MNPTSQDFRAFSIRRNCVYLVVSSNFSECLLFQIFCRTVEFFEPQERRLSLSATQSGGGGSTAGGQGKKDASTKEGPDSSGKDKNEDENKKVMFIDKDCSEKNETGSKL